MCDKSVTCVFSIFALAFLCTFFTSLLLDKVKCRKWKAKITEFEESGKLACDDKNCFKNH